MQLKAETVDMSIPQRIAAIPAYIPSHNKDIFKDAAPGHKFLGYFRNWQGTDGDTFAPYKGKAKLIGQIPPGPQKRAANDQLKSEFDAVLNEVCALPAASTAQITALRARQSSLIQHFGANGYRISTTSTAPFATGLGNEHPIENGFAFLTPYGLPYLAGSGAKGILRRSMQELLDDGEAGFTHSTINALFGPELDPESGNKPEDAKRGALDFWDVFPSPEKGKLTVEIMTPHYSKYYQGEESPHDSGAPVPVSFLAVPAKSQFDFHVVCHTSRLPHDLASQWRTLLDRAFQHAFEWVGFGAKTSVGYGAMATTDAKTFTGASDATSSIQTAPSAPVENWPSARLKFNRGNNTLTAEANGKSANAYAPQGEALLQSLAADVQSKIRLNQCFEKFAVEVSGNVLISIQS
jgi:CRISPR-associated protein Cmr6